MYVIAGEQWVVVVLLSRPVFSMSNRQIVELLYSDDLRINHSMEDTVVHDDINYLVSVTMVVQSPLPNQIDDPPVSSRSLSARGSLAVLLTVE
ncbi:uncharacterized protein PHACADRAFT_250576 [Phanerochaete carnosa HHB-10118-sp]|uniref:Uncharacterized protein n=1 Tax=Phanerochaete carnosa (strain HHB-10118-sp) TaxID=650164 RepID=K5XAA9_PHACS|nr:uncharacterized protein PHACADRAFT_250576 [Phanerochaete carnosa HHB-10118-sp]EKM59837.1 hypothetical protein PHACADRAFT_250576 [Phanerochaete carnosa HHB-10118-sp]